jgi:hypothetical protein
MPDLPEGFDPGYCLLPIGWHGLSFYVTTDR